jgi:hypothetical protein
LIEAGRALAGQVDDFFSAAEFERIALLGSEESEYAAIRTRLMATEPYRMAELVEAWAQGPYPAERLADSILRFTDVRLQLQYSRYLGGLINAEYYIPRHHSLGQQASPRLALKRMALEQSEIGGARAAWEKLMRAVFWVETGTDLTRSSSKSLKSKFFNWTDKQPPSTWRFLSAYRQVISVHDDSLRTPEFHKHSVLRAWIFRDTEPFDANDLHILTNYLGNNVWPNVLSIVSGHSPSSFSDVHLIADESRRIDPIYLAGALSERESAEER